MNVTDFSQTAVWLFWVGVLAIVGGVLWATMQRSLKAMETALIAIVLGAILLSVSTLVAVPTSTTGPPVIVVPGATGVFTVGSAGLSGNLTVNSASHTITGAMFWNATLGNFVLGSLGGGKGGGKESTFTIPVSIGRSDALNATAGFNVIVANLPTQANVTNGIVYSPIAYTPATGTASGAWSIAYSAGSITAPNVAAPAVTTMNPDLIGVPAFGSKSVSITFTLAGAGFNALQIAQYSGFSFTIEVTGGSGVTPSAYTVDLTVASAPPTGTL